MENSYADSTLKKMAADWKLRNEQSVSLAERVGFEPTVPLINGTIA